MTTRPYRVAITHTRFSYTGGIEKYIYSLVERLLSAGHEVHYFAHRFEPYDHERLTFHPVPWRRFPKSFRVRNFDRSLNRCLDPHEFDLVHGFTKSSRQDIYTDGSGTLLEYVDATHAEWPEWRRRLYRASPHQRAILTLERERFQRDAIRRILPMANFVKEQILRHYPVDPERIEVTYSGVEIETFHPRHREDEGPRFREEHGIPPADAVLLFVGNDWKRKGLDVALKALPEITKTLPNARLAVAGHDNHPEQFRQLAERLGVTNRVTWLGSVREIRNAFAASDVFVFPSRYDVFGNVGLEALATGVPAVLSSASGVGELLESVRVGSDALAGERLEDPEDSSELARHVRALLNPDQLAERRVTARRLAERYSWDRHFARILEIYDEVVREKEAR